jgi:acylphosphatase
MQGEHEAGAGDQVLRLEACVRGRVQGVGFRAFVRDEARRLALRGVVWNGDDSAVYVIAEGPRSVLTALLTRLERGPSMARPSGVEVYWRAATGAEPEPFQVIG